VIDLALDTNAAVDFIRDDRLSPPQINAAGRVLVPLTVIGELFFGASCSDRPDANYSIIKTTLERWDALLPDIETARIYGEVRAATFQKTNNLGVSRVNDLWDRSALHPAQAPASYN
jgi:tRNA(fMet)-specific endonuclease VapC